MDLGYTLLWMVGAASVVGLAAMLVRYKLRYPGWLAVYSLNAALVVVLARLAPAEAGYISFAIWTPTVLIPTFAVRWASRLVVMQRYEQARRLLLVASALHPFDGWRQQPKLLRALGHLQRGEVERSRALLEEAQGADTWLGRAARLQIYRLDRRWEELRRWFEAHPSPEELRRDPTAVSFYLRALGELGDVEALLRAYADAAPRTELSVQLPTLQLFVAAFAGRPGLVEVILGGTLAHFPPEQKAFWVGTSHQAAGDVERARGLFEPIAREGSPLVRRFAELRLGEPIAAAPKEGMSAEGKSTIEGMAREVEAARVAVGVTKRPPIAAFVIALITVGVFLAELPGGSTDQENLYRMGALVLSPGEGFEVETWRVLTACFLHYGAVHLVMNMLGLLFLGRLLERAVGAARFCVVYLAAGVGSNALYMLAAGARGGEPMLLVGASGCIMGIVGALMAIYARRWRRDRTRVSRAQLLPFLAMLVGQSVFDLMTPQIAMVVHLAGVVLGFAVCWRMGEPATKRER